MKRIVCLCHDVTEEDIVHAVRLGYDHPETAKRFTAALMGPCQGRGCGERFLDVIAREMGVERSGLRMPTARPPTFGVRMGQLAGGEPVDR